MPPVLGLIGLTSPFYIGEMSLQTEIYTILVHSPFQSTNILTAKIRQNTTNHD